MIKLRPQGSSFLAIAGIVSVMLCSCQMAPAHASGHQAGAPMAAPHCPEHPGSADETGTDDSSTEMDCCSGTAFATEAIRATLVHAEFEFDSTTLTAVPSPALTPLTGIEATGSPPGCPRVLDRTCSLLI